MCLSSQRISIILLLASGLGACMNPIRRSNDVAAPVEESIPGFNAPDLKKRLWVLPFRLSTTPAAVMNGVAVADILKSQVQGIFSEQNSPFLAQNANDEARNEINPDLGMDPKEISKILKGSDAAGFLSGEIVGLDFRQVGADSEGLLKTRSVELSLTVKYELFDVNTSRRLASGTETTKHIDTRSDLFGTLLSLPEPEKKLAALSTSFAEKLLKRLMPISEKLAWSGRILRIEGGRIFVNAGRRSGIVIGENLKAVDASKDILDPQTGELLGVAPGRIKGSLKVIQYFGQDGAMAVIQSGGGFQAGDRVELF